MPSEGERGVVDLANRLAVKQKLSMCCSKYIYLFRYEVCICLHRSTDGSRPLVDSLEDYQKRILQGTPASTSSQYRLEAK